MSSFFRCLGPFAFFFSCLAAKKNEDYEDDEDFGARWLGAGFFGLGKNQDPSPRCTNFMDSLLREGEKMAAFHGVRKCR